ncbi:MAG: hypothetical protein ACK4PI_05450 [Tepidisphaerales bacterium]
MYGEVTWDHLDRLIDAFAAAGLYLTDLRDLESRIARACADLLRYPPTFDDLTALLVSRSVSRELVTRRVAWASQHIFNRRAWCVGSKVLVRLPRPGAVASPLLEQLRVLGYVSAGEQERQACRSADETLPRTESLETGIEIDVPRLDKIDALMVSAASDEVWVVKGCAYSTTVKLSPGLWINSDRGSLFGVDDRFMTRVFAAAAQVRTLLAARDLVQIAYPVLKVRACFVVINDPGCSWHFQAHDLTSAVPGTLDEHRVLLDRYPVVSTHRDMPEKFAAESLELADLPQWPMDEWMTPLAADRPGRSLMLLTELWHRQLNRPKRLATARGDDLAESVARHTGVCMGRDQWRHDLEDCLERGGFVRRLPDRPGRFAITPRGVARVLMLRRKLGASPPISAAQLMSHVLHQSRLWAVAPVT